MEIQEYVRMEHYEKNYWWHIGRRYILEQILTKFVNPTGKLSVLDLGCGTGVNYGWLKSWGKVTGLDSSREAIEYCQNRHAYDELILGDASRLSKGGFDLITAFDILEHIANDTTALIEWYGRLKSGGYVLATVPAHQCLFNKHDQVLHHHRRYSAIEMRRKFEAAGFVIRFISPFFFFVFPVFAIVRLIMGRRPKTTYETASATTHTEGVLVWLSSLEAALMRCRISLPVGSSILVIAQKSDN